jgi:Lamin Tail Domain
MKNTRYKIALFVLLGQLLFWNSLPAVVSAADSASPATDPVLYISAVQITGGTGRTQEDFIELYNPTDMPFDLNGYRLVKRTATATTDTLIQSWTSVKIVPAHHFFLWANNAFSGIATIPDASTSGTLADNNGIALRRGNNDTGTIIASAAWGSTVNGFLSVSSENPGAGQSIQKQNIFIDDSIFRIAASSPRNSTTLLPIPEPEPIPTPEPLPDPEPTPTPDPLPDPQPAPVPSPDPTPSPAPIPDPIPAPNPVPSTEALPDIQITELLPNPVGSDSGAEEVELFNNGSSTVTLTGFKLDDVGPTDPLSSNAYILPTVDLPANSYVALTVPLGKFAMNNTDGDVISLFNPSGDNIDTIAYTDLAPEGKSFTKFDSGWEWAAPTLGQENGSPPPAEDQDDDEPQEEEDQTQYDNSDLVISEIYPDPEIGGQEFIEIYNSGEEMAELSLTQLWIGTRHRALPEEELKPGEYFVVNPDDLPVQLRNSGQIINLQQDSTIIDSVTYPTAIKGSSYSFFEDGFLWTIEVTQGKENILKLPEVVKKDIAPVAAKTAILTTTKAKATASKATAKPVAKASSKPSTVAVGKTAEPAVAKLPTDTNLDTSNEAMENNASSASKQKESLAKILAMGAAAVAAGVAALYKLVFAAGIE